MWELVHHCDLRSQLLAALPAPSLTCKSAARGAAVHVGLAFHYITVWRDTGLCIFKQRGEEGETAWRTVDGGRKGQKANFFFVLLFGNSNFLELAQLCRGRETLLSHVSLGPWFIYPLPANWDHRCDQVWRGAVGENVYHFLGIRLKWQVQRRLFAKVKAMATPQSIGQSVCQF